MNITAKTKIFKIEHKNQNIVMIFENTKEKEYPNKSRLEDDSHRKSISDLFIKYIVKFPRFIYGVYASNGR